MTFLIVCADAATDATAGTAAGGSTDAVVAVVAVEVVDVAGAAGTDAVVAVVAGTAGFSGTRFFIRSGKSFGATAAPSPRNPIEISTATKIRFSISRDP